MTPPVIPNPTADQGDYQKCEAEIKALSDRVAALEQQVGSQDSDDAPQSDNPFSAVKSGGSY